MKSFQEFINACESYKSYKPLPRGRMDRRAARTAAVGLGHLGLASAAIGAENVVGEVGDLPDEIAKAEIERSIKPLERSSKIIKTRLTHSPEQSKRKEVKNKEKN